MPRPVRASRLGSTLSCSSSMVDQQKRQKLRTLTVTWGKNVRARIKLAIEGVASIRITKSFKSLINWATTVL